MIFFARSCCGCGNDDDGEGDGDGLRDLDHDLVVVMMMKVSVWQGFDGAFGVLVEFGSTGASTALGGANLGKCRRASVRR
jgi:hypothetical protein